MISIAKISHALCDASGPASGLARWNSTPERAEEDNGEQSLRPLALSEFIGQQKLRENLRRRKGQARESAAGGSMGGESNGEGDEEREGVEPS